jgi:hypothetical protein
MAIFMSFIFTVSFIRCVKRIRCLMTAKFLFGKQRAGAKFWLNPGSVSESKAAFDSFTDYGYTRRKKTALVPSTFVIVTLVLVHEPLTPVQLVLKPTDAGLTCDSNRHPR